jgi:tetratricopeptide (TPR) repeat protein
MRRDVPVLVGVLLLSTVVGALAQSHPVHRIPAVPDDLLARPVPLRTGIGHAHDPVSTRSKEAQAYYDQGLAYLHAYVWIEAARSFNQALRVDPQLAPALVGLSLACAELNKPEASRAALQKAQQLATTASAHDRLHVELRGAQVAAENQPSDRTKLAAYRSALDAALTRYPDDAELWMLRGIAESADPFERGQGSGSSAVPFYEKALALGGTAAHHYLTHAFENTGRVGEAVEHAEAYARLAAAVPHALHMHGHVLRRAGRIAQAVAAFETADRVQQEYFRAEGVPPEYEWHHEHNLDLLGSSYRYLGQMAKAERFLKAAFELPSSLAVQMYNKRGWPEFLIGRGRIDEALAASAVLTSHPVTLVRATGHITAARAQLAAGRPAQAAEQTNLALRALRMASGGQALVAPAFQHLQGEFFLRTGERDKGRAMLRDVVRTVRALPGPDNWVQALFTLESIAGAARAAGDWEFAAWTAQQMLEHDPNYAGSHYARGLVAQQAGDAATASRELDTAARLWAQADPDLAELRLTKSARR